MDFIFWRLTNLTGYVENINMTMTFITQTD